MEKLEIANILEKSLRESNINIPTKDLINLIEIPPNSEMGDFAFPCFSLASKLKKSPQQIAQELKIKLEKILSKSFEKIESNGPYLNFFINRKLLAVNLIKDILTKKDSFGRLNKNNKNVMIEFPSPNTNKPLHLGHLRNMSIGESISRICEFNGFNIIRANLNNDKGVHICKSMLAYKKFGKNKKPDKKTKPDHFVGDFYVMFNEKSKKNPSLEKEAQEFLKKYEAGDKETIELWKKMNKWALDGFKETYKKFGIKLDKEYYESQIYEKGKEIIYDGLKKGLFYKTDDGAIASRLIINSVLTDKILLRADKTSLYITQDIYLAKLKFEEFNLNSSIYVVANEQDYHFNVLFEILEKLGIASKQKLKHLSYGMVFLPTGKMKSREGTVVDADDLIEEIRKLMEQELKEREKLSKKELEKRSLLIALSAIKYFLLKIESKKNMIFNPKESINLEGDTGPYLLYSYARANSILKKAKKSSQISFEELEQEEINLIKKLSLFKEIVVKSYNSLNPSLIANYSYELSKLFNEFYSKCPVLNSEKESFRLKLVESFKQVLKNSLYLLGIDVLERM
jgi:arginyl-tRNA synthetase